MDKALLYNQSGIKDETAYKAITNIRNRSKADMNGYVISKGEIWEVENGGYTKYVVVLACFDKFAATIMLNDQQPTNNAVRIRAHDIMYADAGRLGWTFYDKAVEYVRTLSTDEDRELRQAIGAALEIPVDEAPLDSMAADANREIEGLQYEIAQLRNELAATKEVVEYQAKELEDLAVAPQGTAEQIAKEAVEMLEDLAAARKEAEIYKELYENMLARALG